MTSSGLNMPPIAYRFVSIFLCIFIAVMACASTPAHAQELLQNRSFENPVTPSDGDNLYATIPAWTAIDVAPSQPTPFNIVRPFSGLADNPTATPSDGGVQYLDIANAGATIVQIIDIQSQGMIDLSGWYSVREFQRPLTGLTISLRNSSNFVVATAKTDFTAADPIGLWKQAFTWNIPVEAGTYSVEVFIPDNANFDLASLVIKPALTVTKTSVAFSDPVSLANPKMIPGALTEYSITVATPPSYTVTNDSMSISDTTPENTALVVSDIAGPGSGPVLFTAGASMLSYSFISLASTSDDVEFSNDQGASWNYTPIVGANGTDPAVTGIRLRPKGTMAASSTLSSKFRYRVD